MMKLVILVALIIGVKSTFASNKLKKSSWINAVDQRISTLFELKNCLKITKKNSEIVACFKANNKRLKMIKGDDKIFTDAEKRFKKRFKKRE